ncbi:MAG: mycofactocin precursor MftA [Dehalococcoidia bacterium]
MVSDSVPTKRDDGQTVEPEQAVDWAEPSSPPQGEGELEEELIIKEITIDGICGVY